MKSRFWQAIRWTMFGTGPGDSIKALLRFLGMSRWALAGFAVLAAKADYRWEIWFGAFVLALIVDQIWMWIGNVTAPPTIEIR